MWPRLLAELFGQHLYSSQIQLKAHLYLCKKKQEMKEYASWSIYHYDCSSYCAPKRFQSSEVMHAHFSSSLQLVIMLGGSVVLTHAGDTLTKMIRIRLLASISLTLPRMWLWLPEECVCAQHFKPARGCATFGSLACCLHLNPQEMENGLQFLKLTLRSDGLKMQLLGLSLWAPCSF